MDKTMYVGSMLELDSAWQNLKIKKYISIDKYCLGKCHFDICLYQSVAWKSTLRISSITGE